jgi:hypothetical protein
MSSWSPEAKNLEESKNGRWIFELRSATFANRSLANCRSLQISIDK